MMAEEHLEWIMVKNPDIQLHCSDICFRPYSMDKTVPVMGYLKVKMRNNRGGTQLTRAYIVEDETDSLLGKEDAIDLGILKINPATGSRL